MIHNIPESINAETLLAYLPEGSYRVAMRGQHKRLAYQDIVDKEEKADGTMIFGLARNSLYNVLPEFMFHPIDRFDNLPQEEKERFAEEYEKQEREKENAYRFFAPIDLLLLNLRKKVREKLIPYTETDKVLIDILGDELTTEQRSNSLICQVLPFLPSCKIIRGNKTLLTLLLRKIFMEEGLDICVRKRTKEYTDPTPRYTDGLGGTLGDCYVGNVYDELVHCYEIHYWSDEKCDEHFLKFIDEVEGFRRFMEDYFLSVEETLHFDISTDGPPLRLSDEMVYNYLDYNTNI